jgi:D-alanine-D-alanine ligase
MRKYSVVVVGAPQRVGAGSGKPDALGWFLERAGQLVALSDKRAKLSVAVQEVGTERYSVLMPHRVLATIVVSFLQKSRADEVEEKLRDLLKSNAKALQIRLEMLEERSPMTRSPEESPLMRQLKQLSEQWKLPFGVGSSLFPSAAGEIPPGIPTVCGLGPLGLDLFTPEERIHRGELLQRTLLLALLLEASGDET